MTRESSELRRVEQALRDEYLRGPAPEVAERHLAMIARAASAPAAERRTLVGSERARSRFGRRPRLALAAVAAAFGLPISLAGLAVAGVDLPDPAVSAFEAIGIGLPNQSDDAKADGAKDRNGGASDARDAAGAKADELPSRSGSGSADQRAGSRGDSRGPGSGRPNRTPGVSPEGSPSAPPAGIPPGTPSGPPAGTPSGPPSETPSGPPTGTPSGPPSGTPSGPPAGTPSGVPQGTTGSPPAGVPLGPPAGVAVGPPAGTQSGPPEGSRATYGSAR